MAGTIQSWSTPPDQRENNVVIWCGNHCRLGRVPVNVVRSNEFLKPSDFNLPAIFAPPLSRRVPITAGNTDLPTTGGRLGVSACKCDITRVVKPATIRGVGRNVVSQMRVAHNRAPAIQVKQVEKQRTRPSLDSRIAGGLVGLLIGDSVGVPYEFKTQEAIPPVELIEMTPPQGFQRSHPGVPPGTWSDDGAQALCLLESLLDCGELNLDDFGSRLLRWLDEGHLIPDGRVFDCGIQTREALGRVRSGVSPCGSGGAKERDNGNGSLMRVLPLALWHRGDARSLVADAHSQSLVTHAHRTSQVCCALYCLWARRWLMYGLKDSWEEAVTELSAIYRERRRGQFFVPDYSAELAGVLEYGQSTRPAGSGYVVDTLWAARHILAENREFKAVIRGAIALGSDTDTTACVAGGLAGIRDGLEGIPEHWRKQLRGATLYKPLLDRLSARLADLYNPSRRIIEMVAVLLDMGYQKLRFFPYVGKYGEWRFIITVGDSPKCENTRITICQASMHDNIGLGWGDAPWDDPQRLAFKFLLTFPRIAELARGYDFAYASWYRDALSKTPSGESFALWWDGEALADHGFTESSTRDPKIPFPPGWPNRRS